MLLQWDKNNEAMMRECLEAMVVRSQNPMCVIEVRACMHAYVRACVRARVRERDKDREGGVG